MGTVRESRWVCLATLLAVWLAACSSEGARSGPGYADATSGSGDTVGAGADPVPIPFRDPAKNGPYAVGIATFVMPKGDTLNDVKVEVWYPAAEVSATTATYEAMGLEVPAGGYRGVAPEPKAHRLLVAFSHGFGGVRWQNYTMAERLASHGYIVVAPDHPGSTIDDIGNYGNAAKFLIHRPATLIAAANAIHGGAVPGLVPRGTTYAVVGHSMGALTSLVLGGGVISPDAYAAECGKAEHDGGCDIVGPMTEVTPADLALVAPPDPRIVAMVVQNPAGTYALAPGSLTHLPKTLLMSGDKDGFYTSGAVAAFDAAQTGTAFVTYLNGGHNGPTDMCNIPVARAIAADCKPNAGYADPPVLREASVRHVIAWLGTRFGQQPQYQTSLASGDGFVWKSK